MKKYSDESRKVRYEARNEIEQIIKDGNIDRKNFKETAKNEYEKVIRKFYFTFCDHQNHPGIHLNYVWLGLRKELMSDKPVRCGNWEEYIDGIDKLIPENPKCGEYYLMTNYGWVYTGKLKEIKKVLKEATAACFDDFYILPKKHEFDWVICHCDDGDCMVKYTI